MLHKLLSTEQDAILKEERQQLEGLLFTLGRLDAASKDTLPLLPVSYTHLTLPTKA